MAISDVKAFAHLDDKQVEAIGAELDALRKEIEDSRGAADAAYIRKVIKVQRGLVVGARVVLFGARWKPAWVVGTGMLAAAKILENMEIGHNVMHGQWDWMNDPEIHSSTWEWDTACPADQWKHSHNFVHHTFTNVLGRDADVGYGILRVTSDQKWNPANLGQPVYNALLALLFQYGVALHDLDLDGVMKGKADLPEMKRQLKGIVRKTARQTTKDYIVFPALSGPGWKATMSANATANLIRNLWSYMIIFCGHFPDGAEKFTPDHLKTETPAEWYLRQLYGSANFKGGPLLHVMSGNLGYQIEHHLFPDLPSNRYGQMSKQIQEMCESYGLDYTTGPLYRQYWQTLRTITRLALPNRMTKGRMRSESEGPGVSLRSRARRSSGDHLQRQWRAAPEPAALTTN